MASNSLHTNNVFTLNINSAGGGNGKGSKFFKMREVEQIEPQTTLVTSVCTNNTNLKAILSISNHDY